MIVYNEFSEFQKVAEKIDSQMFFVNFYIYRLKRGETPRNVSGRIYIDETDDEGYFGGELVHEAAHSVFDPVTVYNYVTCVNRIKNEVHVSDERAMKLANIASDLIGAFDVARNKVLNSYRRRAIEYMYRGVKGVEDPVLREMLGISKRLHGCKFGFKVESTLFNDVKKVVESDLPRADKYVEIARLFSGFMEISEQMRSKKGAEEELEGLERWFGDVPISVDAKEAEEVAQQILSSSQNFSEAWSMINILAKVAGEFRGSNLTLANFYEAKARNVMMYVSYPHEPIQKGVKVGSLRWKPHYGVRAIDVKRTMMRYGVNVPLVTTQSARFVDKFISSHENRRPCDLVVSIDVSGSTGSPLGMMNDVCDYEIVMFYALVNMAKLIDQRIGLTLWSVGINYTSLPYMLDWRESDKLKQVIIDKWSGGGTSIISALRQAKNNPDKLFFVFTDGEVAYSELIDVDNVVFFLVKPTERSYVEFVVKYGERRVIRIDNISNIPKITLEHYVKLFKG